MARPSTWSAGSGVPGAGPGLGARACYHPDDAPTGGYDAVVDASTGPNAPARALDQVDPGGRVVLVGVAGAPSLVDTRAAVLRDITVVGLLPPASACARRSRRSPAARVWPEPLVARVVGLDDLAARAERAAVPGAPKIQVAP